MIQSQEWFHFIKKSHNMSFKFRCQSYSFRLPFLWEKKNAIHFKSLLVLQVKKIISQLELGRFTVFR